MKTMKQKKKPKEQLRTKEIDMEKTWQPNWHM